MPLLLARIAIIILMLISIPVASFLPQPLVGKWVYREPSSQCQVKRIRDSNLFCLYCERAKMALVYADGHCDMDYIDWTRAQLGGNLFSASSVH